MKCQIITCEELAHHPFLACDSKHGMMLKIARDVIKLLKENPDDKHALSQWHWYFESERPTEEEIKHYE